MKPLVKSLVVAGLIATAGWSAWAQSSGPSQTPPMGEHRMHQMDPGKMERIVAKRLAELKTKLKITATQEDAWTAFSTAMKPPTRNVEQRPNRAELDKLSTPERIDKMHALRTQHMADMNAAMDKRDEAIKAFYAVLTPEQKKVFDAEHARMDRHHEHGPKDAKAGSGGLS